MIAPLGRALVLLSLLFAAAGAVAGFAAARQGARSVLLWARRLAFAYAFAIVAANLLMVYALVAHDFSVGYVAQVGSRSVPLWVSVVSLWSSLEGSILFWGAVLGIYIAAATWLERHLDDDLAGSAIGVWLSCAAFFSLLIAAPAQPFDTVVNPPMDGPGPNPLLQNHVLMALHPPFLYLGYVGMTIPFGLASAALLGGRFERDLLRGIRTWLLTSWTALTIAIVLGGWWAYEVLGWGGYWAWDPVENASLLPWLTATAAIHSALVVERRRALRAWTLVLIQATFLLTILGTFMTRSGVFNSVHSFTQSAIGPTLLGFLGFALIWTVFLLATRIDRIPSEEHPIDLASRESTFLINNLLLVLFTLTVLIGTVFPLVVEALKGAQMSVGRPYFDRMAVPLGAALLLLMGIGPALPWGRPTRDQVRRRILLPLVTAAVVVSFSALLGVRNGWALLTLFFAGYTLHVTLAEIVPPLVRQLRAAGTPEAFEIARLRRGRRLIGSYLVHGGVILAIVAIAVSSTMGTSHEVQLRRGESARAGDYDVRFEGTTVVDEPHRRSVLAHVRVARGGDAFALAPRMNEYAMMREPIGTPDVETTLTRDIYLSILNIDPSSDTVALHVIINPMIGWLWAAAGVIALGALILLSSTFARGSRRAEIRVETPPAVEAIAVTSRKKKRRHR